MLSFNLPKIIADTRGRTLKRLAVFLLFSLITVNCFSNTAESDPAGAGPAGIGFSIRFYEKRIYFLDDPNHPVQLETVITNNSPHTYRFKMTNYRVYILDFEVTTPTNIMLNHSRKFTIARNTNQPVLFREISLEPGEKYGIVVSLSDFINIDKPGLYVIRAVFFPELNLNDSGETLRSNNLILNIRPAIVSPEERAVIEEETGKLLARESLPPDEVIAYTLGARQKSQWEKFFLYLDLESLFLRQPDRARRYRQMSEEDRKRTLDLFKKDLKQEKVDNDILVIPSSFEIIQTSYTPFEATVLVLEKFDYRDYTEVKRYTYTLQRRDRLWLVTDYSLTNLGTE